MATNTAASFTNLTGNGTAGPFNVSFSYLSEAEVDVTVDGVLKTLGTHYTFTSATQITFTTGNEPANGIAVRFQRDTNIGSKKVDFVDGSVLTEIDLDTNTDQVLFSLQEIIDNGAVSVATTSTNGSMSAFDKAKLDNIEPFADVTDATNVDNAGAVMNSDLDGKGELLVGDGVGDPTALSVGQDGYILKANSSTATGLEWVLASSINAPISGDEQVNWDVDYNGYDLKGVDTLNVRLIKFIGAASAGSSTGTGPRLFNTTAGTLQLAFPYNGGANYSTTISFSGPFGETHFFSPLRISDTVNVKTIANTYHGSGGYIGFWVEVDNKTQNNRYGANTGSGLSFQFKDYKARGLNIQNNPSKLGEFKDSPAFHAVPGITYRFDQTDSSNLTYTLGFFTDEARTTPYTTGVTTVGSAGNSDPAYTQITFTESTPQILYYGATNTLSSFDYMGNIIITNTGITGASSGGGGGGLNNVVEDLTPELGGNLDGLQKGINNISSLSISDGNTGTYGQISFLGFGAGTGPRIRHTNTGDVAINRVYGGGGSYYDTFIFGPHVGPNTSTVPFVCTDTIWSSGFANSYTTLKQYYVTVANKVSGEHRYHGTGSSEGYVIQDFADKGFNVSGNPTPLGEAKQAPFLYLVAGTTYRFDQSASTNAGHQIAFYLEANKTTQYTTGVTTVGTAGQAGAYTEITITDTTPIVLHYQCINHSYMGNCVTTNSNVVNYNDLTNKPTAYTNSSVDTHLNVSPTPPSTGHLLSWNGSDYAWVAQSSGATDKISEGNTEAETVDTGSDGHFKVTTEGTERLRVIADGKVGIGTSTPSTELEVNGSFKVTGGITSNGALRIENSGPAIVLNDIDNDSDFQVGNENGVFRIRDTTHSTNRLTINSAGVVDISGNLNTGAGVDVTGNITVSGAINETVYTITDGASVDLDPDNGMIQQWTLGQNRTATESLTTGQSMMLMVSAGSYTLTFPTITWVGGTAPTLATSGYTVIELWKTASTLYGATVGDVA